MASLFLAISISPGLDWDWSVQRVMGGRVAEGGKVDQCSRGSRDDNMIQRFFSGQFSCSYYTELNQVVIQ